MKKLSLLTLVTTVSLSSFAFAGGMGGCNNSSFCGSAFVGLEGGYSWNMIDGYNFNFIGTGTSITSVEDNQGYTGRLSAGIISALDDQFAVSGEMGWGYYGRTKLTPSVTGNLGAFNITDTITGFDTLLGVAYTQPSFSLFLKAGALFQNMQTKTNISLNPLGLPIVNTLNVQDNHTQVLPEIKLGGAYHFNDNWAITAAYFYAFGDSPALTGDFNVNTGSIGVNVNTQNPSLNTVLFGVQYTV